MHELYIAESILALTVKLLPPGADRNAVRRLEVEVGQLDAVVPENLHFLFNAVKGSFGMPQAELLIGIEEVSCQCLDCEHIFTIDLPIFICPACQSGRIDVLQGRGIRLIKIITED